MTEMVLSVLKPAAPYYSSNHVTTPPHCHVLRSRTVITQSNILFNHMRIPEERKILELVKKHTTKKKQKKHPAFRRPMYNEMLD